MALPNFDRLGIEKDMQEEFSYIYSTDLQRLINSCYFQSPFITNKPEDGEYCQIEVVECENDFWYKDLIGLQFFCQIIYQDYGRGKFIKEFKGVKLTRNKMIIFRSFSPKDIIII